MWSKPCSCCSQFEIDQAKKQDTRAKRAARRSAQPRNPPPETIQVTTVPVYPNLQTIVTRQMNSYYGYSYFHAPSSESYNPWGTTRN
jgi:hypothetical protein